MRIEETDGGHAVALKVAAATAAAGGRLKAWEAEEFARSVLIFKESDETIRPIIDQLKSAPSDGLDNDADRLAAIQERCLRVLQALLRGDTTMQEKLNQMGVTSVIVRMFAAPSSPKIFEAALELGTALLDGGNTRVQKTVFTELSTSGSNDALASIASALNSQCQKIQMCALARQPTRCPIRPVHPIRPALHPQPVSPSGAQIRTHGCTAPRR